MNRYWLSFQLSSSLEAFAYHGPWWVSGYGFDADGNEQPCVCVAMCAENEDKAKEQTLALFDAAPDIVEWRFINPREDDWEPFCDRFPRAAWMHWPLSPERITELRRAV